MGTLAHPAIVILGVAVYEAGSLIMEYSGESTSTNFTIYNPVGNQFKGTLDFEQTADFYLNGSCSTVNYHKIWYRSLESGRVIYVVFISFLYILSVLSHGLIGVKVPGSTCTGV